MNQSLFVGFWNINLSPPIGNRWNKSKVDKKIKVSRVIQGLLKLDFDFYVFVRFHLRIWSL